MTRSISATEALDPCVLQDEPTRIRNPRLERSMHRGAHPHADAPRPNSLVAQCVMCAV